jgi:hypothetical protein
MLGQLVGKSYKIFCGILLAGTVLFLCQRMLASPAVRAQGAQMEISTVIHDSANCGNNLNEYDLNLDGVDFVLCLPFQVERFISSTKEDIFQVASGRSIADHKLVMIQAIPYGFNFRALEIPEPLKGNGLIIRDALAHAYLGTDKDILQGPEAKMFGMEIGSLYSLIRNEIAISPLKREMSNIWVTEAGDRIWIVHVTQEYPEGYPEISLRKDLKELSRISITSGNVNAKSISMVSGAMPVPGSAITSLSSSEQSDLPFPSWWDGDCDANNWNVSYPDNPSYPLGSQYRGVKACGPLKSQTGLYRKVYFFPNAYDVYEWMCSELVKRYLYIAYGTAPYPGWGKDIVYDYPNSNLIQIANGTEGKAPQPGDVLGFDGPDTDYGHAVIVSFSSIDSNGNGYIQYIEQNFSDNGIGQVNVVNWWVESPLVALAWLHDPTQDTATPSITPTVSNTPTLTVTLTPTLTHTPSSTPTYTPTATYTPTPVKVFLPLNIK